ncbi:SGNH/GDSL hydrolase family protein [Candidatus Curtissbacteria bacterium]|nr:SGNH/GDSL hydrolase family protein [Candidatus Curtissbacteria bacterium]
MLATIWPHASYFLKDFSPYIVLLVSSFLILVFGSYKIYKSNFSERKKKIFLSLIFTLFIFVLVFSCFEAYFRYRYDESDGLGFLKVSQKWHQRHVQINGDYFRDREFEASKKEGVYRIGVIGDSLAEGDGIKNVQNRFSNLLEKKLNEAGYRTEVYNISRAGYDTEGEIVIYNKYKYLNFDLIVWEYFINDIQPQEASTGTPIMVKNSRRAKIVDFISDKSFFLDYLYWRFSSVYDKTINALRNADIEQYKNQQRLAQHTQEITNFISSLKADNKKIVVIMFPSIQLLSQSYPTFINDIMHKIFADNQVNVIDLYDSLKDKDPKSLRASKFDTHPNESVHKLASEKLFEEVKKQIQQ